MNVESIMTRNPKTCTDDARLGDAARLMWENDCGAIPVTTADGSGRLVGMLTDRDTCMSAFLNGTPLQHLAVADAMSRTVMTCKPSDSLTHAAALLREGRIRRLPVVDAEGKVVGLLSLADLARAAQTKDAKAEFTTATLAETLAAVSTRPTPATATTETKVPRALLPK